MIHYEYVNNQGRLMAEKIQQAGLQHHGEAIVFVGALGICVRKVLPMVCDKYTDPAVLCVDSTGRYVIPVLSGHIGGANQLARRIAAVLGAEAVITTQSDNMGLWSLDTLATQFGWQQAPTDRKAMNRAIAAFVNGEPTALFLHQEDEGTKFLRETCPEHVTINPEQGAINPGQGGSNPGQGAIDPKQGAFSVCITVADNTLTIQHIAGTQASCPQQPRLTLGIGCQKDAPASCADQMLEEIRQQGIDLTHITSIATIELKAQEPMLSRLCECLPWAQRRIFSAAELAAVEVPHPSEKVFEVTGCYGVAEASALLGGHVLEVPKTKGCCDGVHYTWAIGRQAGHIEIVGAGPGDPELVSVRGKRFLEQADLILYAGSLVPKELTLYAKAGCVVRSSADMDLEQQFRLMKAYYDRGCLVVRLHTGDPCIYGAIQEQMAFFDEYGMDYHITPGISSFLAAAAELRSQFTIPERCQTIILTRGEGRTPMPEKEKLQLLAAHQSTMCIFLSASIVDEVQRQLLEGGYPPETPVAACYKLTWKDQRIYRGQLKDLARLLKDNKLTLTTMIVVGEAIDNRQGLSKLYDGHFTHLFRKGVEEATSSTPSGADC